jgi:hypothetical protein
MDFKPLFLLKGFNKTGDVLVSTIFWNSNKSSTPLFKTLLKPYHDMIIIEHLFTIASWNARMSFALTLFELCVMT